MDKAFLTSMEERLVKERAQLQAEHPDGSSTSVGKSVAFPDFGDDEDENANEVAAYNDKVSVESELSKELRDTLNALERIKDGSYGVCKYCKTEISEARLTARPTSTSCIACKKTLTQEA